jgi:thymidylate synthase
MKEKYLSPTFETLDEIQHWVLATILEHGEAAEPRGKHTLELFPVSFALLNPRNRCVLNPLRKWSFALALGEFCWHVSGSNELEFIEYYASRWRDFTEDGSTISGSCYGHRVFSDKRGGASQWERLIDVLKSDPHSRRAILYFSDSTDHFSDSSKDVPCATTLQFFLRSGRLHAIAQMRSNDAMWGLPYDVFLFTMLQELLANELGTEIGTYYHSVASLHLYEYHFERARRIVGHDSVRSSGMPKMTGHNQLPLFLRLEERLRRGDYASNAEEAQTLNSYWKSLLTVLEEYRRKKLEHDDPRPSLSMLTAVG